LTRQGGLNVRLVFRDRDRGTSITLNFPLSGVMSAELAAALDNALPNGLRVRQTLPEVAA
jgi:hypothetical protein